MLNMGFEFHRFQVLAGFMVKLAGYDRADMDLDGFVSHIRYDSRFGQEFAIFTRRDRCQT